MLSPSYQKAAMQKETDAEVEEFLAKGGEIKKVAPGSKPNYKRLREAKIEQPASTDFNPRKESKELLRKAKEREEKLEAYREEKLRRKLAGEDVSNMTPPSLEEEE